MAKLADGSLAITGSVLIAMLGVSVKRPVSHCMFTGKRLAIGAGVWVLVRNNSAKCGTGGSGESPRSLTAHTLRFDPALGPLPIGSRQDPKCKAS